MKTYAELVFLKNNLKEIAYNIMENYIRKCNINDIFGFALYSDENAMSMSISVNTYKHHKNNAENDPENELYYKFNPEEWSDIIENNELDKLNKYMQKICLKLKKKQFSEYRNNIYKLSSEILEELKSSQIFKEIKNDFVLLFSVSDCDLPEMVIENNKKYNSKEMVTEYEQWIQEESEYKEDD